MVDPRVVKLLMAALAAVALLGVGCGRPAAGAPDVSRVGFDGSGDAPPTAPLLKYELPATATPWPTFTPVPAETAPPENAGLGGSGGGNGDVDGEIESVAEFAAAAPTVVPRDLPEANRVVKVAPFATVTPTPALPEISRATPRPTREGGSEESVGENAAEGILDYGQLPGGVAVFDRQVLFASDVPEVLPSVREGDFSQLGSSLKSVSARTRFLFWAVRWEPEALEEGEGSTDFEFRGWARLTGYLSRGETRFVYDGKVQTVRDEHPYVVVGWGTPDGQFWKPGRHRLEFLDDLTEEVIVEWEFTVYR